MTPAEVLTLIIIGIVALVVLSSDVIDAWKKIKLAEKGYEEDKEGKLKRL